MSEYITIIALIIAAVALVSAGAMCLQYRRMERMKNSSITRHVRERDSIEREMERLRIENQTLEKMIRTKSCETGKGKHSPPGGKPIDKR